MNMPLSAPSTEPIASASVSLFTLLDRWFTAWVARSEARWRLVELRQRYY